MRRGVWVLFLLVGVGGFCLAGGEPAYTPAGVVAYKGKINYKVFTGVEKLNGRIDVILLRDAGNLDGHEHYLLLDKKRKIVWTYINSRRIDTWQENDGTNDLDVLDLWPEIYFELAGNEVEIEVEVGGYARQKTVNIFFVPPPAAVVKSTFVDVFKSMPVKGISWTTTTVPGDDDDEEHDGMGWATGSLRYNKKLTKELNTDPEIEGDIDAAWESLKEGYEDEGYEDGGVFDT